ncbi:MAG: Kelch repeat-containing protein [Polyangiaceae bacterium]
MLLSRATSRIVLALAIAFAPTSFAACGGSHLLSSDDAIDAGSRDASASDAGFEDAAFTWREVSPCPLPRFEAMGTFVGDRLLVMGGFTSGKLDKTLLVHAYDPIHDTWETRTELPVSPEHSGLAVQGRIVYLAGGLDPINNFVWAYDVERDTYAEMPAMQTFRAAMALVIYDGTLHAITGLASDGQSDLDVHQTLALDAGLGTPWTTLPEHVPNPRNHLGGAAIGDRIFIVGGRHNWDEQAGNQDTLSIFDPATSTWADGPPIPLARSEINGSTFAMHDKLVVVGGAVNPAHPSAQVFVFDPRTNAWSQLPDLPGPRKGAVAAQWNDSIIVSTGSPTGTDPDGTTWIGCCMN